MSVVTASLVVSFSDSADGTSGALVAEFDSRDPAEGGLNGGSTSFRPGDRPAFLVYRTSNVIQDTPRASEGTIQQVGTASIQKEEWVTFAGQDEATLQFPASGGVTVLDSAGINNVTLIAQRTLRLAAPGVGVVRVRYNTNPRVYRLNNASGTRPVVIFISGTAY